MKRIACFIGIIVGIVIVIIGFSLMGEEFYPLGERNSDGSLISFGADFYTEIYHITATVANQVQETYVILSTTIAWLIVSLGAFDICYFFSKLGSEVDKETNPETSKQGEVTEETEEKKPFYTPTPQVSSTWICPRCSTTNKSSVQYCIECDTAKPQTGRPQTSSTWTCKHCNTMNSNNSSQCKRCGKYKG